jgi:hypothetical protein
MESSQGRRQQHSLPPPHRTYLIPVHHTHHQRRDIRKDLLLGRIHRKNLIVIKAILLRIISCDLNLPLLREAHRARRAPASPRLNVENRANPAVHANVALEIDNFVPQLPTLHHLEAVALLSRRDFSE